MINRNPENIHIPEQSVGVDLCVRPHVASKIHSDINPNVCPMNISVVLNKTPGRHFQGNCGNVIIGNALCAIMMNYRKSENISSIIREIGQMTH